MLARSAAPPTVSADATVLVLAEGAIRWVVGEEGANGATCYVSRTWAGTIEPHCFDSEGSKMILPIQLRTLEMGHAGATAEEIEAEIEAGKPADGRFLVPFAPRHVPHAIVGSAAGERPGTGGRRLEAAQCSTGPG